jgi:hypothetical protein
MKNKLYFLTILLLLLVNYGCHKNLSGNAVTVDASTNSDTIINFWLHRSCEAGPGGIPPGSKYNFENLGNGQYFLKITEGYKNKCFTVTGTIPANTDTIGKTVFNLKAYFTNEGNVIGFQDIELKRPHSEYLIRYDFRTDTYIE